MISFIVPYKNDNKEREINLEYAKNYYPNLIPESEFIVEEHKGNNTFNKCKLYNKAVTKAKFDILCFLDADIFVSKEALKKSIDLCKDDNNVVIGYNGTAIYLTFKAKKQLHKNFTYKDLLNFLPNKGGYKPVVHHRDDIFNVASVNAKGGCLLMNKKCYTDIGGFNPNFKNWGCEDTEIIYRSNKLKKCVMFVNTKNSFLFHLAHSDDSKPRTAGIEDDFKQNEAELNKVLNMDYSNLKEYIKTWKLV